MDVTLLLGGDFIMAKKRAKFQNSIVLANFKKREGIAFILLK